MNLPDASAEAPEDARTSPHLVEDQLQWNTDSAYPAFGKSIRSIIVDGQMKLISELRRRNVLRMAALYSIAAWIILQVVEVVMDLAKLSEWIGTRGRS